MSDARIRARLLKSTLAALDQQPRRAELRERIGPQVVSAIEEAMGADWLPIAHDVAMERGLAAVLGPAGSAALTRGMMRKVLQGPLLGALLDAATKAFGLDPGSWAGWVPKAWALIYQGAGSWVIQRTGALEVTLTLSGIPPECLEDEPWAASIASAISAMVDLARATGGAELVALEPEARRAVYRLRWKPGAATGGRPTPPPAASSS